MQTDATGLGLMALLTVPGCASWKRFAYEGWKRDGWQQPQDVLDALRIGNGARVADLGAGGGYFTFQLAKVVGPHGKVYAVDIDPDMLDYLRQRAENEQARNIEVLGATADDPRLPADGVDVLFTCDAYHHIAEPVQYFRNAKRYLRPGGRLAIIDHNGKGWFSGLFGHHTSSDKLRRDMLAAGYKIVAQPGFLKKQNFIIAVPDAV